MQCILYICSMVKVGCASPLLTGMTMAAIGCLPEERASRDSQYKRAVHVVTDRARNCFTLRVIKRESQEWTSVAIAPTLSWFFVLHTANLLSVL